MSDTTFIPMLSNGDQQFNRHGVPIFKFQGERFDSLKKAIDFVEKKVGKKQGKCVGVVIKEFANVGFSEFHYRRQEEGWACLFEDKAGGSQWLLLDESETGKSVVFRTVALQPPRVRGTPCK